MSRELMPKSGIVMPHVVINRDAAVVGVSTVDGVAGAVDLTGKYLQKTDAEATYLTKTDGATKTYVTEAIEPVMEGALFKADPFVANDVPFRSAGANGVESVDIVKVTPENTIKIGSYASSIQGVEIHSAGRLQVVDQDDGGVETKYPVYSKRYRPEIDDLPFAAIGSYVRDSKGRTIGVTRTGINSDIKQLTQKVTFTQPVTVADAVGDYDAVTLRQLRNSGGGSGGPTMSGISNFGIGDFHLRDSRAFIPAFEVFADGQLLNRADYPDLWAYAQLLSPIADSLWLGSTAQRGKYSLGNGTTTFRVPDRNGVQSGSVPGLFGRGDGGDSSLNGVVRSNAAPNITGSAGVSISTQYNTAGDTGIGAIVSAPVIIPGLKVDTTGTTSLNYRDGLRIDASLSNPSYGRDSTAEVRPNAFTGVWTIRANGGFTAANTSWAVINQDSTRPSSGITADGGELISDYNVNGVNEARASLRMRAAIGATYYARLNVSNATSGQTAVYDFNEKGDLSIPGMISAKANATIGGSVTIDSGQYPQLSMRPLYIGGTSVPDTVVGGMMFFEAALGTNGTKYYRLFFRRKDGNRTGEVTLDFPTSTSGTLALQGTSGRDYKKDITPADSKEAFDRINSQNLVNFVYKDDEQERVRFGVIAEDAEVIAPQYIKHNSAIEEEFFDEDGNKTGEVLKDRPSVDVNPIVMDLMGAVQYLKGEVDQLRAELAELKASK